MENIENNVPEQIKEQFNTGYVYSKHYPELSERIIFQILKDVNENSPISGLISGMREYLDSPEWIRKSQLKDIRNPQGGEKEHDIKR